VVQSLEQSTVFVVITSLNTYSSINVI